MVEVSTTTLLGSLARSLLVNYTTTNMLCLLAAILLFGYDRHMKSNNEIKREQKASEFCQDKSTEELKTYLADTPVPYNLWKDADHKTVIKLVTEAYDEV